MANINKLQELKASQVLCDPDLDNSFIGKGGFGVVILGNHPVYGPVAIKCFSVDGGETQTIIESFKDESEMLQRANHENVARVHGWAKWHLSLGLIMQYYEGGNLGSFLLNMLCDVGPLLRLRIALEIAKSLLFLHNFSPEKSLIHGDLKPDNVLLTSDLHCKLADFGGARLVNHTGMATTMGIPQSNAFTPLFAAPEVLSSEHSIKPNKRHDVYSYGMLVYVVLAREYPFSGQGNIFSRMNKIINGIRPDCSAIKLYKRTLSKPEQAIISCLESLMLRCWVQSPDKRPTMLQVHNELQQMFNQQSSGMVLEQMINAVKQLKLQPKSSKMKQEVPLDRFITHTAKFDQGPLPRNQAHQRKPTENLNQATPESPDDKLQLVQVGSVKQLLKRFQPSATSETNTVIRPVQKVKPTKHAEPSEPARPLHKVKPIKKVKQSLEEMFNFKDGDESALKLVQKYLNFVREKKYEEANRVAADLHLLIQGQVETTAEELREFGEKLKDENKCLESVLILQISSIISANDENPEKAVKGIKLCAVELVLTNIKMIESDDTMKVIVREHVLPLMRGLQLQIEKNKNVDEKFRVLNLAFCLYFIGWSEYLIDDLESLEESSRKAIRLMEETFACEASKHQIYAHCLDNLGAVCERTSRIADAVKYFERTLEAYKKAEDYPSEKEKKEFIETTENYLKICKEYLGK